MSWENLPLADVAIAIQSIAATPDLTLTGIDLDTGQSLTIQIAGKTLSELSSQQTPPPSGLVLVLTLYADIPSQAA